MKASTQALLIGASCMVLTAIACYRDEGVVGAFCLMVAFYFYGVLLICEAIEKSGDKEGDK